jgi:nicotinamidase/pyrazinamidase
VTTVVGSRSDSDRDPTIARRMATVRDSTVTRHKEHAAMPEALVIVDYQNDFIPPDGALAVAGGDAIVDRINELARDPRFDLVVATRDWHPPNHLSFREQGGPWPPHCVQGTRGAELHPDLDTSRIAEIIDTGTRPEDEGYSAFEEPRMAEVLREHGITDVTVVGLATDYCVLNTARDALREGFRVTVDTSAVRAVDVNPGDGDRALAELEELGARIVDLSAA